MKLQLTYGETLDQGASLAEWDMGAEFAAELLSDINLVSGRKAPFRIDTEDYKVYWAGTILRVDINSDGLSRS